MTNHTNPLLAALDEAELQGRKAYLMGWSAAPALNPTVRDLIGDSAVGAAWSTAVMKAFTAGFRHEADIAAAEVFA